MACGCALLAVAGLLFGLLRLQSTERIWVLTGSGGLYAGPLDRLDRSREFFTETALLASQAALQWSAAGFDLPELLKLYFRPAQIVGLQKELAGRLDDIRARSLSTKPLIHSVSDPVPDGDARLVQVRGVLATSGHFGGRPIYEEPTFMLSLRFKRNPDLGAAGRYPWQVVESTLVLGGEP